MLRIVPMLLIVAALAPALAAQGPPAALVATAPVRELEFHDQLTLVGRTAARAERVSSMAR